MSAQPLDSATFPFLGMALIEASAGTGKTFTIANLYLRLLLGDKGHEALTVDRILVVTFTIAATEELRERIRQRIVLAYQAFVAGDSEDEFIKSLIQTNNNRQRACARLDAARRQMDEASVFTIHGFCSRALADNAFESGMGFEFAMVMDETLLLQQAAEDFWRAHIATLTPDELALCPKQWKSPETVLKAIRPYLGSKPLRLEPALTWNPDQAGPDEQTVLELKRLWLKDNLSDMLAALPYNKSSAYAKEPGCFDAMRAFCESADLQFSYLQRSWVWWTHDKIRGGMPKAKRDQLQEHPAFDLCAQLADAEAREEEQRKLYLLHTAITSVKQSLRRAKAQIEQLSPDDLLEKMDKALKHPGSGPLLARRLGDKYPQLLVDEFQDTDTIQYSIFEAIHQARPGHGWTMIGDPKQAIYKFRGADVFTYIHARQQVLRGSGQLFTLDTNWRSSSAMVEAVNGLFGRVKDAFIYSEDIPFHPVVASPQADREPMMIDGKPPVPLQFVYCRGEGEKGVLYTGAARERLADKVAMEIAGMLQAGIDQTARIGERNIEPADIAVLVRDRSEAAAVQASLAARGVNSVFLSRDNVFDSPLAVELYHVLQAVLHPANERKLRSALATSLLGASMGEIAALDEDPLALQTLLGEFAEYAMHCARHGVLSTLRQIMAHRQIPARLLAAADGQRRMTDLRHLGELLQQASETTSGMHDLLRWYKRHLVVEGREDSESQRIRLESESKLVQIVTIHASKGLEFNLVYLPLASVARMSTEIIYHDDEAEAEVTIAELVESEAGRQKADKERLAEDLRLLYVAVTRARYACWIGLANIRKRSPTLPMGDSALGHLLALPRGEVREEDLWDKLVDCVAELGKDSARLEDFDSTTTNRIPVVWQPEVEASLSCPPPVRLPLDHWHLTSYSALARGHSVPTLQGGAGDEEDRVEVTPQPDEDVRNSFTFPRGPRFGNLLHNILELVSFGCDRQVLGQVAQQQLEAFGLAINEWGEAVADWLLEVLARPLPPQSGLSLALLPETARLSEMEFNFCLGNTINAAGLDTLLRQYGYLAEGSRLSFSDVSGVMRGFIDLVFEYQGRFYLLDYKSNHLGNSTAHYDQQAMREAIVEHQYDLQYLIYSVAMHRFLGQRIAGYDYQQHFGGVYYLFLRGMVGDSGDAGVFFDKPPLALVETLDSFFGGGAQH